MLSGQLMKARLFSSNKSKYQQPSLSRVNFFQIRKSSTKTIYESLDPIYNSLDRVMINGIKTARLENKKLLIATGELHHNKACLLTEIMLLSIAYRYLINTLYVECSPGEVSGYSDIKGNLLKNSGLQYFECYDHEKYNHINMLDSYLITKNRYKMEIKGIDSLSLRMEQRHCTHPTALEEKNWYTSREEYMRNQLISSNTNGIAFFGLFHLSGIMEHTRLNAQYHIVGINISSGFEYDELLKSYANDPQVSLIRNNVLYPIESKRVIQLPCLDKNRFFMVQAVKDTLQFCEDKERVLGYGIVK